MISISMCYSNTTIINIYSIYRKLSIKIIVNGGGYRITTEYTLGEYALCQVICSIRGVLSTWGWIKIKKKVSNTK
jgi:hypothetical protein